MSENVTPLGFAEELCDFVRSKTLNRVGLFRTEKFHFCVFLKDATLTESSIGTIRRIIEEQKPAHTSYSLKVLEPLFYLDKHTYLGVNTVPNKLEFEFIIGKTVIGRNSVLVDKEQAGQLGVRSRIGIDTKLT